jgi:hypothetical protein
VTQTPQDAATPGGPLRVDGYVGDVLSFDGVIVDEFESYTDDEGNRISQTWIDGSTNGTGSLVGNVTAPFAERTIVHSGKQSMPLAYDNARSPFYSEVEREFTHVQNWSPGRMNTLSLWIRGNTVSFAQTSPGVFVMSASGADIWTNNDRFRYAYGRLTGDGSIVARVDSLGNTDVWAKAGVMIRESLDRGAMNAFMYVTPNGRRGFQDRPINKSGVCLSAHSRPGTISLPFWVKVERKGNLFTAYYSTDGGTWIKHPVDEDVTTYQTPNPQTIQMPPSVCIGLALNSHTADSVTTATFSHVETTGMVRGQWQVADIGIDQPGNSPDDLYVIVKDSDGRVAVVTNPDPVAVNALAWTEWKIPLSSFTGVNLAKVKKVYIGVGGRRIPVPGGTGRIYIDDIRVSKQ